MNGASQVGVWGGVLIFTEIQGICIQEADEMLGSTDPFFPSGGCDGGMGPWLHWSLLAREESSKPLLARPYVGMLRLANLALDSQKATTLRKLHQNR